MLPRTRLSIAALSIVAGDPHNERRTCQRPGLLRTRRVAEHDRPATTPSPASGNTDGVAEVISLDARLPPSAAVQAGGKPSFDLENPKAYYQTERKLRRSQRAQKRHATGSRGWWEAQRRIDRLNRRMIGMRRNAQRQMTAQLVHKFQRLVIEDLNVAGMMGGKTPKAQADAGMGELNRQLIHKGQWHHCEVTLTHRFYPSSKRCSNCQTMNAKLKRERFWQCPACGTPHDRNENAVVNLRDLLTLPADSGVKLRDGPALTIGCPDGETSPADRRTVGTAYCLCGASNSPRNTHPDTKASP